MSKIIDWMYHRKGCTSCAKSREFLEQASYEIREIVDATKNKKPREAALELARTVDKVVVGKGKKVVTFDLKHAPPDEDTLAAALLGPTGNLKAPTLRLGKLLLVGFSEAAYREVFGESQ